MPVRIDPAALCHLDTSSRFSPSLDAIRAVIVGARALVSTGPARAPELLGALVTSDPTGGLAAHYARKLLSRICPEPFLVRWLGVPDRSRREVLALLDRALRCFAPVHRGGWQVSSAA
jgi:hypothetical protein